jgi:aryl-alcohol dehydrogenase-like predicted oxidoreductase
VTTCGQPTGRSANVARAILCRAFELGITHFDLANSYGPLYGSAEQNFGRLFAQDFGPYRDELVISTKAGYDMWPGPYGDHGSRKYLLASLDQSLQRMGLDYVDSFYSHRFDPETPLEETIGALATAVRQGKALYVGIRGERRLGVADPRGSQGIYSVAGQWNQITGLTAATTPVSVGAPRSTPSSTSSLTLPR